MTPVATSFLVILSALFLSLPRKFATLPFLIGICYITGGPRIEIGPFSFTILRTLITIGFIRILARGEKKHFVKTPMDLPYYIWLFCFVICGLMLNKSFGNMIEYLGQTYDALGLYFIFRCLVSSKDDLLFLLKEMAIVMIPMALIMLNEKITGRNFFYFLGGVPEFTAVRDGRLRCQGAFSHAILAGTTGAAAVGFAIASWWHDKSKKLLITGMAAGVLIVYFSNSSGPIMTLLQVLFGIMFWKYRYEMRKIMLASVLFISSRTAHILCDRPFIRMVVVRNELHTALDGYRGYMEHRPY